MKILRILIIVTASIIVLLAIALTVIQKGRQSQSNIPVLYKLPEFSFTERSDIPFGKQQLMGKVNVVDFIFTNCPGPCPFMSSKMGELYRIFSGTDKVRFISISIDPNRDSLTTLQRYAERYGVNDQRWVFLRGPMTDVINLYENGFKLGGILPVDHTTKFILVDQNAMIRGYYDSYDNISMKLLKNHIVQLLKTD